VRLVPHRLSKSVTIDERYTRAAEIQVQRPAAALVKGEGVAIGVRRQGKELDGPTS